MLKRTTPIVLLVAVGLAVGAHNPAPITKPYDPRIDPADFGGPIDNPYLPMKPGTVFRYRGIGDDGTTRELNIVRVTRRTKRIMGIDAVVVLDKVWSGGRPEERTFDWYAQDKQGNVWYLGEDSSDRRHGRWVRNDGSWTSGVHNAKPGVVMLGHPRRGDAYRQEFSAGHAEDQAKVLGPGGRVTTPFRTFAHTLLTREFSNLDKQSEKKWYARGIGMVHQRGLGKSGEHFDLISVVHRH